MKVECSQCGHLGPAADVRQGDEGVEVICEECGAVNTLGMDEESTSNEEVSSRGIDGEVATDDHSFEDDPDLPDLEHPTPDPSSYGSRDLTLEEQEALERLIPEQGAGMRCPKCAALLDGSVDNCGRCGLDIDEARHYDDGEAPWQTPPAGLESEHEQAGLLWEAYCESREVDDLEQFVDFIDEHGLYETAIRRLRFYLVDEPDDEAVHEALGDLLSGVQSQVVAARARAEANAEELNEDIKRFKRRVALGIIVGGTLLVAVIASIVW